MVPQANLMVMNRAPPAARGRALGVMTSAIYLGEFLNPILVAPLTRIVGIQGAFLAVGVMLALADLVLFRADQAPSSDEAANPGQRARG